MGDRRSVDDGPMRMNELRSLADHPALWATADPGRTLEISTRIPLHETMLRWWCEERGEAATFGSDAHGRASEVAESPLVFASSRDICVGAT